MLSLFAAALLAAAPAPATGTSAAAPAPAATAPAPAAAAPAKKIPPKPFPAATEEHAGEQDDGHGHAAAAHQDEKPLDEKGKKIVAVSESLAGLTRESIAAYHEMLAAARDSKECAATAKQVAARAKKLETDLAAKRKKSDELRKGLELREQQDAAGIAMMSLKDELAKTRAAGEEDSKVVLGYRGKCPKQADEVDKAIAAVRKRIVP